MLDVHHLSASSSGWVCHDYSASHSHVAHGGPEHAHSHDCVQWRCGHNEAHRTSFTRQKDEIARKAKALLYNEGYVPPGQYEDVAAELRGIIQAADRAKRSSKFAAEGAMAAAASAMQAVNRSVHQVVGPGVGNTSPYMPVFTADQVLGLQASPSPEYALAVQAAWASFQRAAADRKGLLPQQANGRSFL
eukprot:gnl/MRDRNA2_/MRDRNA2_28361_c0_seq1.p1 gnl/MRDRNA2_/MRDRNA2_28361_c0~~gnl/MRDRNA2_/MRDRNA2_28361_c0_seq1.p1  ORF type:complete len:190 (+),score=32.01 gnl/MRDRNA2_/MRDRNA2_28361_c0_seq1:91-660(+)